MPDPIPGQVPEGETSQNEAFQEEYEKFRLDRVRRIFDELKQDFADINEKAKTAGSFIAVRELITDLGLVAAMAAEDPGIIVDPKTKFEDIASREISPKVLAERIVSNRGHFIGFTEDLSQDEAENE